MLTRWQVEAPFFPGVLFYLSKWYTKSELNLRMSIFYSGSLISGAFGNLIAAGILKGLGHSHGLSPWQWLYIIEGAITVFVGILVILILPDFPDTWKSLPAELKHVANRRLAIEAAEADVDEGGAMSQIKGFKVSSSSCPKNQSLTDPARDDRCEYICPRTGLHGHDWCCWLPKFLPDSDSYSGILSHGFFAAVCSTLSLHHFLGLGSFSALRQNR